jgi:hypothetical protein
MDVFTVSNLLSSACDMVGMCGTKVQSLNKNKPGFVVTASDEADWPFDFELDTAKNVGAEGKADKEVEAQAGSVHGMPGMNYNSMNHVDAYLLKKASMGKDQKDITLNLDADCDIPELCPDYVGPYNAG